MKFCDVCGNALTVKAEGDKKFFFCKKCNTKSILTGELVFKTRTGEEKEIAVFDAEESNFPITKTMCPKCLEVEEAEWTLIQTRAADEPPTRFYRCRKCRHVWREYG